MITQEVVLFGFLVVFYKLTILVYFSASFFGVEDKFGLLLLYVAVLDYAILLVLVLDSILAKEAFR